MEVKLEIEKLQEERRKIDERIKQLRNGSPTISGRAKLDKEVYPTQRPDRHYVAILSSHYEVRRENGRWRSIISANTKEDAIKQIPEVIRDLQALYDSLYNAELMETFKE